MKILVLTFYYEPDLSAGSFRATALVRALRDLAPSGTKIDVVTTQPNRYGSYRQEASDSAREADIHRIALPHHRSDMLGQSRAFMKFARSALAYTKGRKYDVVFATSSRLMTAALGALIARRNAASLYLDIRDIFTETISELLKKPLSSVVEWVMGALESWTIRSADHVNLVSPGFEAYFASRYPGRKFSYFTNGIDEEFLRRPAATADRGQGRPRLKIVYAGNIGEGQCLHAILPGLAARLEATADFVVIGDGGRRSLLESSLAGLSNVKVENPIPRAQLLKAYEEADVLFLHLGDYKAFLRVLPSKLFEYAALGKPILAGVAGYAAQFIREEIENAAVFAPGDVEGGVAALRMLRLEDRPRDEFKEKYSRHGIARSMAREIIDVGVKRGEEDGPPRATR